MARMQAQTERKAAQLDLTSHLGGAVVLLPTIWVAMSLTSGRSIFGPVWLGLARYTLAGVGFAALFAVRPSSQPLAVLAGSGAALVLPSVLLFWRQRSG